MLDVLIAERDKIMINIYKNMLHWSTYGFEIASITDSEVQAISYYGEYRHALVICGLELQQGNGLSLIRKLKEIDSDCTIVVISNHDDYSNVHEALRLRVLDYLIKKDLKATQLADVLLEARQIYEQKHKEQAWQSSLEHLLGRIRDHQEIDKDKLESLLSSSQLDCLNDAYCLVLVRMDNVRQINRRLKIYDSPNWISEEEYISLYKNCLQQREKLRLVIMKCIHQGLLDIPHFLLFIKRHSALIIIRKEDRSKFMIKSHELKRNIELECHADFSITVGMSSTGRNMFMNSFHSLMRGQELKFYQGDSCIIDLEKPIEWKKANLYKIELHRSLQRAISKKQSREVIRLIQQILRFIKNNQIEKDIVQEYFVSIFEILEEKFSNTGFGDFSLQKEAVVESESFEFLEFELDRIFKTLHDQIGAINSNQHAKVSGIICYINEHLHEPLSALEVAQELRISVVYASKLLKEKTGFSLSQYIVHKKMEKAKEMLEDTDFKIKEIANLLGYVDQLYFSRQFHKVHGESPLAYRKKQGAIWINQNRLHG